jgi:hypothetical protein
MSNVLSGLVTTIAAHKWPRALEQWHAEIEAGIRTEDAPLDALWQAARVEADARDWIEAGHKALREASLLYRSIAGAQGESTHECDTRWRLDQLLARPDLLEPPIAAAPRFSWRSRSTLFAASEKRGKSTILGYVAAQASNGSPILGAECGVQTVLIIGLEEFTGDLVRRLKTFGANPKRVHVVDRVSTLPSKRVDEVRQHVEETGATLVIIDTLMAFLSGAVTDASASAQMQPFVQSLTDQARETGAGFVIVGHGNKATGSYRDSSAIGGAVDVIMEMFAPTDKEIAASGDPSLRSVKVRGRLDAADFQYRYDGSTFALVSAGDTAAAASLTATLGVLTSEQSGIAQQIVKVVAAYPGASNRQVRDRVTGRAKDIDRLLAMLVEKGRIVDQRSGNAHRYYVPDGGRPPLDTTEESTRPVLGTTSRDAGSHGTTAGRHRDDPTDDVPCASVCRPPLHRGDDNTLGGAACENAA